MRPVPSEQLFGCLILIFRISAYEMDLLRLANGDTGDVLARARASSAIAEGLQQAPPPATEPHWHLLHAQHFLLTYQY